MGFQHGNPAAIKICEVCGGIVFGNPAAAAKCASWRASSWTPRSRHTKGSMKGFALRKPAAITKCELWWVFAICMVKGYINREQGFALRVSQLSDCCLRMSLCHVRRGDRDAVLSAGAVADSLACSSAMRWRINFKTGGCKGSPILMTSAASLCLVYSWSCPTFAPGKRENRLSASCSMVSGCISWGVQVGSVSSFSKKSLGLGSCLSQAW